MELLSRRAEAAIDRLIKFAHGDQSLVNKALYLYNAGTVTDVTGYIREHRKQPEHLVPNAPSSGPSRPPEP